MRLSFRLAPYTLHAAGAPTSSLRMFVPFNSWPCWYFPSLSKHVYPLWLTEYHSLGLASNKFSEGEIKLSVCTFDSEWEVEAGSVFERGTSVVKLYQSKWRIIMESTVRPKCMVRFVWWPIVLLKCPPLMLTLRDAWKKELEGSGGFKHLEAKSSY